MATKKSSKKAPAKKVRTMRAAMKQNVEAMLRHAFKKIAARKVKDDEIVIDWFDDGSGIERIYANNPDGTIELLDFDAAREVCYELFGGYPEEREEYLWSGLAIKNLWKAFRIKHSIPESVEYYAALSEADRERCGEDWFKIFEDGRRIVFRQDDPT